VKNILKLYQYVSDAKWLMLLTGICSVLSGIGGAAIPFAYKLVIDSVVAHSQHVSARLNNDIFLALGIMLAISLADRTIDYFSHRYAMTIRERIDASLRERIFAHLLSLSADYYEKHKLGEITQRVNLGLGNFASLIQELLSTPLTQSVTLVVMLILIWRLNPYAGLVSCLIIPYNVVLSIRRLRKIKPLRKAANEASEKLYGHFNETLMHFSTVKTTTSDAAVMERYQELNQKSMALDIERFLAFWRSWTWRGLFNDVALVTSIGIIGLGAARGQNTVGDILLIALYVQRIGGSIPSLVRVAEEISEQETSSERLIEMLEAKPTVADKPDAIAIDQLETIEFKNVSFFYPGKKRKALENVSFEVKPGQTLALVGPSGTGKSTITKLMLRFYAPTSGQILINGQSIENFTQESIRRHMGVVMQDVALFNDTIEANLQLANPNASKSQIRAAAEQAHANVFIERLPDRYKALVGERGVKLSGGEKQRVAIARAILKDPQLIILDEATSALDSESERHVQAGLAELLEGRTAVVIAHRLSTVMNADEIVVLRDGKVVERGTHNQLRLRKNGLYAKLFKLQTEGVISKV
jgi:ABC-type multidrug transport system fused ATPase/permease subunit